MPLHKRAKSEPDVSLNYAIYEAKYATANNEIKTSVEPKETQYYEPFLEIIESLILKNNFTRILDYGCGPGKVGLYLSRTNQKNYILTGIDISETAVELALKNGYTNAYASDGRFFPENEKFDIVLLNSIIEHIEQEALKKLFQKIRHVTDSVFIVVPNFGSPRRYWIGRKKELEKEKTELGHINILSKQDIYDLLKQNGFTKISFSFWHIFKNLKLLNYEQLHNCKWLSPLYTLLALFPFYYIRESFWIYAEKPKHSRD